MYVLVCFQSAMSSNAELLVNQRPTRTIKRRRFSDEDVIDEQHSALESPFDLGGGAPGGSLKYRSGAGDYGSVPKVPNRSSSSVATSPIGEVDKMTSSTKAAVSAASVNVPVNRKPKSSSKRQKNRVQFMNTLVSYNYNSNRRILKLDFAGISVFNFYHNWISIAFVRSRILWMNLHLSMAFSPNSNLMLTRGFRHVNCKKKSLKL